MSKDCSVFACFRSCLFKFIFPAQRKYLRSQDFHLAHQSCGWMLNQRPGVVICLKNYKQKYLCLYFHTHLHISWDLSRCHKMQIITFFVRADYQLALLAKPGMQINSWMNNVQQYGTQFLKFAFSKSDKIPWTPHEPPKWKPDQIIKFFN